MDHYQRSAELTRLSEHLDIPQEVYQKAVGLYTQLGEWLEENDEQTGRRPPEIYPQGSFRLGTVVRPIIGDDEYDIDLVYQRDIKKESTTQAQLKEEAGEAVRSFLHKELPGQAALKSRRRCWTIDFENEPFHMDVLPAITNPNRPPTGNLITDRKLSEWLPTNPITYSSWFFNQMAEALSEAKRSHARNVSARIEDVEDWQVKTTLQRCVQLLKRHRDIYFNGKSDVKPVSILITTLAAHAYNNSSDLFSAWTSIIQGMPAFVSTSNGKYEVLNPAELNENFADKWNENPALVIAFRQWIHELQSTLLHSPTQYAQVFGVRGPAPEKAEDRIPVLSDDAHAKPLPLPRVHTRNVVTIKRSVHRARGKRKEIGYGLRNAVHKGKWLRFEAVTDFPQTHEIRWQVTNTGPFASELRGGFESSNDGSGVRWEQTAYPGTHWVKAIVIAAGHVVAESEKFLVRIYQ